MVIYFRPQSVEYHKKQLKKSGKLKSDNNENTKKRITFYSRLMHDSQINLHLAIHLNISKLFFLSEGIPDVRYSPEQLLTIRGVTYPQHYSGVMLHKYGDANGQK